MAGKGSAPGERRGGRQKGTPNLSTREMKAKAQGYAEATLEALFAMVNKVDEPIPGRVMAARELLDRGFGKAAQPLKVSHESERYDWTKIPIEKARLVADALRLAQRDGLVIEHE